jgi:predicted small lipoprotein YifL
MKRHVSAFFALAILLTLGACSPDGDPQFRVQNNRADKANVQVQTSGGNTINLNDVSSGQTTSYQTASEGTIVATAVIQNESATPQVRFYAKKGTKSTVVIVAAATPTLHVIQD